MLSASLPSPQIYAVSPLLTEISESGTEATAKAVLKEDVRKGMIALSPAIKTTIYVDNSDEEYINRLLNDTVEELFCEKELFNVCDELSFDGSIAKQGKKYRCEVNLYVKYTSSKDSLAKDKKAFDKAVADIISGVGKNWTDLQKAAYIHDRLVENTEYIQSGNRYTSTPYAALVRHKALCTGYARAYTILLGEVGIESKMISNDSHMWNMVKIDGHWYHVDTTFDDSFINSEQVERITMHKYFLRSADAMKEYYDVPDSTAVSKRFDKMDWDHSSSFAFYGKGIIYVGADGVYRYDTDKNQVVRLFKVTDRWEIKQGVNTTYWTGYSPQMVQYDTYIYYNTDHAVNRYDPKTGKITAVYKNKKSDDMLVGLTVRNGILYGWFADDVNEEGTKKAVLDLKK